MTTGELCRLRPWLYHMTAAENAPRIGRLGELASAAWLLTLAGRGDEACVRRRERLTVVVAGEAVVVCHQRPLHAGAIRFESPDWDFARYVGHLNNRVFFWPGRSAGPVARGVRHYRALAAEGPRVRVLRARTADVIAANAGRGPWVSRCNSGAPRGRALRGDGTFVALDACPWPAAAVAEVTFLDRAVLPAGWEWWGEIG